MTITSEEKESEKWIVNNNEKIRFNHPTKHRDNETLKPNINDERLEKLNNIDKEIQKDLFRNK